MINYDQLWLKIDQNAKKLNMSSEIEHKSKKSLNIWSKMFRFSTLNVETNFKLTQISLKSIS